MQQITKNKVVFIAGPTASGKSGFALDFALRKNGVILNADSMQVYQDLRIISARPTDKDESLVPHRLYGVVTADQNWSVALWAQAAEDAIKAIWAQGRLPILTGGTGLYFKAIEHGLAEVPDVPDAIRQAGSVLFDQSGPQSFHALLGELDPVSARRLHPGDRQRLLRAWEVVTATGVPLSQWQAQDHTGFLGNADVDITRIRVLPDRVWLYNRCDKRVEMMMQDEGIAEVEALLACNINAARPVMKALGVPEITAYLQGRLNKGDAMELLQRNTRHYAKRQFTWFRNQCGDWQHQITQFNNENI